MRRRMLVTLDADPDDVLAAATRVLQLEVVDGALEGPLAETSDPAARLRLAVLPARPPTTVELELRSDLGVPYFGWFVRLIAWVTAPRALRFAAASLRAEVNGQAPPPRPRRSAVLPPVPFDREQAARLAAIAAVGALANFGGSLLTQNAHAVTSSFHRSDEALSFALAVARTGVLLSLVASAFADRYGRRRVILVCLVGVCVSNALTAVAPTFETFTAAQVLARALVNATLVVAAVAAVEEAPEGARAYAFSMFALALGLGFAVSVVLLPLADINADGWRLAFGVSALTVLLLPGIARHVHEPVRYRRLTDRTRERERGRVREVFDRRYGGRFALLGLVAFLVNVFSAPSSQLTNRYLTKVHDFSNSQVALLRSATAGVPGVLGIVVAGRLAETRGRRPVVVTGLIIGSLFQVGFFLGNGALLWLLPAVAIVAAACAGLAVGTMDAELFPTETRGTSNGFLLVCGVAGSAAGLLLATRFEHVVGGLGPGIALCAIAPLLAAVLVVPHLPETRARMLDDISPSDPREE